MSLSVEQLLIIRRALADKVGQAGMVCFPTGINFDGATHFWATVDALNKTTRKSIETTLINAVWIRYLRFEDKADNPNQDAGEVDSPIITRFYEFTVFRQKSYERLDETDAPDDFLKRLLKTEMEVEADVSALVAEFRGIQELPALGDDFVVKETNSLTQDAFIERDVECEFVPGVEGSQVKLVCPVKTQLVNC